MAKRRDYAAESARRNERARAAGFSSYYEQRLARFRAAHPGEPRSAARGHRAVADLEQALSRAKPGTLVSFLGLDRQADGTWRRASFAILSPDGPEREFIVGTRQLGRLPEIAALVAAKGIPTLGADYMQAMVEWAEEHEA